MTLVTLASPRRASWASAVATGMTLILIYYPQQAFVELFSCDVALLPFHGVSPQVIDTQEMSFLDSVFPTEALGRVFRPESLQPSVRGNSGEASEPIIVQSWRLSKRANSWPKTPLTPQICSKHHCLQGRCETRFSVCVSKATKNRSL